MSVFTLLRPRPTRPPSPDSTCGSSPSGTTLNSRLGALSASSDDAYSNADDAPQMAVLEPFPAHGMRAIDTEDTR